MSSVARRPATHASAPTRKVTPARDASPSASLAAMPGDPKRCRLVIASAPRALHGPLSPSRRTAGPSIPASRSCSTPAERGFAKSRHGRQREGEGRAFTLDRSQLDLPAVPLDDLLADGQADARAGVLAASMQALEDDEDALEVLGGDADSVVAHGEAPARARGRGGHANDGRLVPMEL